MSRLNRNEKVVIDYLDNKEMQAAVAAGLRGQGPEAGHSREAANLPHRRPAGTRPRVPVPRVQVHPPLGHQATAEIQGHRDRRHQDHRRLRQLPLRRHPPDRRSRQRLRPRPRRRLQHLLQTRPARRPRPLGPTSSEPHPPAASAPTPSLSRRLEVFHKVDRHDIACIHIVTPSTHPIYDH